MINKRLYSNKCPRCIEVECWEHIIICKVIDTLKYKYILKLYEKLQKYSLYETMQCKIRVMILDIKKYLFFEYKKEYQIQ